MVDGTTVSLPDTPANQAAYPQQSNQKVGLGFPLSRVVAAFDLADGSVVDAAMGGYYGKGAHEQALLRQILPRFKRGDVVLGDALYATYFLLAYNLIRWVMRDSAQLADILAQQISFKHTLQLWQSWSTQARAGEDLEARIQRLLILVAQHRVGHRPGRIEPRAVKRRPKPYALLTVPRAQARAIVRRHGHPNRKKGEGLNSLARNSENQSLRG